jgi:hypothetical protein
MPIDERQRCFVGLLQEHEEALALFYRTCADYFPKYEEFWLSMTAEESKHADWIRRLRSKAETGSLAISDRHLREGAIRTSLEFVNKEILVSRRRPLSKVLLIVMNVESGMIERKFFEVFENDSKEFKSLLGKLQKATQKHLERVRELLSQASRR